MRTRLLSLLHKHGTKQFKRADSTNSGCCRFSLIAKGTLCQYGDPLHMKLQNSCLIQQPHLRLVSTSPSPLSLSNPDTSVRHQLLDSATSELQRVKEYYQSDEYSNNDTSKLSSTSPKILDTSNEVGQFLSDIDTVLFDCDGVLYRSPHPTPDAKQALHSLIIQQKKQVLFVTNNGSVSRKQLRERITSFLQFDHDLLSDDMMISSAYAASQYLKYHNKTTTNTSTKNESNKKNHIVFCIGSDGLCNELQDAGYIVIHANDDMKSSMSRDELANFDFQTLFQQFSSSIPSSTSGNFAIDAVVIGQDTNFTFRKLSIATVLLQWNPNALLIATNLDAYDVTGIDGRHIPGNGSLVNAVEFASNRKAVNVGKPSQTLLELIQTTQQSNDFDVKRSVFVGDRLDTDIRFGVDHGMKSILVLTGVTNVNELRRIHTGTIEEPLPTAIMSHVGVMAL